EPGWWYEGFNCSVGGLHERRELLVPGAGGRGRRTRTGGDARWRAGRRLRRPRVLGGPGEGAGPLRRDGPGEPGRPAYRRGGVDLRIQRRRGVRRRARRGNDLRRWRRWLPPRLGSDPAPGERGRPGD